MKLHKRNINRQPFRGVKVDGVSRLSTLGLQRAWVARGRRGGNVIGACSRHLHAEERVVVFFRVLDHFVAQAVDYAAVRSSRASARHIILNLQFLTDGQDDLRF